MELSEGTGLRVALPRPRLTGAIPIEECLRARRSCRLFSETPVRLDDAGQLLWAAQGITGLCGLRTAPSAGAVYPLHTYLIAMHVSKLGPGAYTYDPYAHTLALRRAGGLRNELLSGACHQTEVDTAALGILLSANLSRSVREFGESGVRLAQIEAGHAAQNVLLQATALSLGAIGMGKLDAVAIRRVVDLPAREEPLLLLLAGPR